MEAKRMSAVRNAANFASSTGAAANCVAHRSKAAAARKDLSGQHFNSIARAQLGPVVCGAVTGCGKSSSAALFRHIMIARLISSFRASSKPGPSAAMPDGMRVYAIGDVHGRLDLLDDLLDQIARDDRDRGGEPAQLIFLGDLIDRGPHSAQVIERLIDLKATRPGCRFILGNHEEVFLKALSGDLKALKFFIRIGGRETVISYGVTETEYIESDYPTLMALLQRQVPAEHIAFLHACEDLVEIGDYIFVHAGVRPERALDDQKLSDLRWIRDDFLSFKGDLGRVVVHGHSMSDEVVQLGHRIGLDTGAFTTGRLSAMGFQASERWILCAERIETAC